MHFPYKKLLNYSGNRYALARACMEYARKVKFLATDDYQNYDEKDAIVSLNHVLDNEVLFTTEKNDIELELGEDSIFFNQKQIDDEKPADEEDKTMENLTEVISRKD